MKHGNVFINIPSSDCNYQHIVLPTYILYEIELQLMMPCSYNKESN